MPHLLEQCHCGGCRRLVDEGSSRPFFVVFLGVIYDDDGHIYVMRNLCDSGVLDVIKNILLNLHGYPSI